MKKIALGMLIVGILVVSGVAIAQSSDGNGKVRVIADTTSPWLKSAYKLMGCQVVHELNDTTALKCPAKVASLLGLREDRIFQIMDLDADAQINADDVWAQGIDGTGVNVAVLDTGIDTNHPELADSIVGCETFVDGTTCEDDHGHGTHVSGIITANGVDSMAKGVAPGAGIYMYKVCDAGGSCYESDMMAAMEAAVLTDAKVMSISIGGGNFSGENCDKDSLAKKVNWVVNQGIIVAVSAGNDKFFVSSPACASGAIAVGAVDKDGFMAYFTNFGPALDIVAPGVSIYSTLPNSEVTLTSYYGLDYGSLSGTSMSAPHIAGTAALALDANPSLTVDELKTALYETADPINPESTCYGVVRKRGRNYWISEVECTSDNFGAGIVNAYGAVNYYVPTVCGNETIEGIEECDGGSLGEATCESLGFSGGILGCTADCTFDTSDCTAPTCIVVPGECNCNGKCGKNEAPTCGDCQ